MNCCKRESQILILMLLIVSSLQDYCPQVYSKTSTGYYNLADKTQAEYTGILSEPNMAVVEEHSTFCPDAASRKYRTINGTCNNVNNLGAALKPQSRLLPPVYHDGFNSPRMYGVDGYLLPSAREVSLRLHPAGDAYSDWAIMVTAWGQWVDHDMVSTPVATKANGTIKCCATGGECPQLPLDRDCFPILLPDDEYVFSGKCLEFVRSLAATDSKGDLLRPRQQVNSVTAFLDGSNIYGSTDEVAESLREKGGYLLRTTDNQFLPASPKAGCVKRNGTGDYCFLAGDIRVNQHPYLGALHTLWLREHNRIARQIRILKPFISNEEVFQEARRIAIATLQAITYNEFLPNVLGEDAVIWKLVSTSGRSVYDSCIDPRVSASFAAAAFRLGHSTIPSYFPIGDKLVMLRYLFNSPAEVYYNLDNVLIGMTGVTKASIKSTQSVDRFFVDDISKYLFLNNGTGKSLDLVSINIQRGRDQGIPPYVKWREFCGLRPLTGFYDTEALGPFVYELSKVYRSPEDIDLYTGIVHEPVDKGMAGPTARCIVKIQFLRSKLGDRFFFDNNEKNSRFTDVQLMALRRTTLAEIICHNSYLKHLPLNVFRFQSASNPLIPCSRIRKDGLNLELFI